MLQIAKKRSNKWVIEFSGEPLLEVQEINGMESLRGHIEHRDEFGEPEAYAGDRELAEVEIVTMNPVDTAIFKARMEAVQNDHSFSVYIMGNDKVILETWMCENAVVKGLSAGGLNRKTTNEFHANTIKVVGNFTLVL